METHLIIFDNKIFDKYVTKYSFYEPIQARKTVFGKRAGQTQGFQQLFFNQNRGNLVRRGPSRKSEKISTARRATVQSTQQNRTGFAHRNFPS